MENKPCIQGEVTTFNHKDYTIGVVKTPGEVKFIYISDDKEVVLSTPNLTFECEFEAFVRVLYENGVFDTLDKESYSKFLEMDIDKMKAQREQLKDEINTINHYLEMKQSRLNNLEERYKQFREKYSRVVDEYINYTEITELV